MKCDKEGLPSATTLTAIMRSAYRVVPYSDGVSRRLRQSRFKRVHTILFSFYYAVCEFDHPLR